MRRTGIAALAAVASSLAIASPAAAYHRYPYTLYDVGTLGGPNAAVANGPNLSATGFVTAVADTATPDPFGATENGAFGGDPFVQHVLLWRRGRTLDLGALGPGDSSFENNVNDLGHVSGFSDTGALNPLTGLAAVHATLWHDRRLRDLGTLGGNESEATQLNDADQVTGVAANTVDDPFSWMGWGTQSRAFLWQNGRMHDLGTLGGPDSLGWQINQAGQVSGASSLSATPSPTTGQLPTDAFLWQNGHMRDLGNLGGSVPAFDGVNALNEHGQVAGQSDLAGDQTAHPFLWNGQRMLDLGTLGGTNGSASAVNDTGLVTGTADLADGTHHGFLWADGRMHDLPPANAKPCSNGASINNRGQVVGNATNCHGGDQDAVLWQHDAATDLNTLIAPTPLHLTEGESINDAGEIVGQATLPNGNVHNIVLVPNR